MEKILSKTLSVDLSSDHQYRYQSDRWRGWGRHCPSEGSMSDATCDRMILTRLIEY